MISLFYVVRLEFVYHADNWTVHSKLYVRLLTLRFVIDRFQIVSDFL